MLQFEGQEMVEPCLTKYFLYNNTQTYSKNIVSDEWSGNVGINFGVAQLPPALKMDGL